jgi:hypothetical protein
MEPHEIPWESHGIAMGMPWDIFVRGREGVRKRDNAQNKLKWLNTPKNMK